MIGSGGGGIEEIEEEEEEDNDDDDDDDDDSCISFSDDSIPLFCYVLNHSILFFLLTISFCSCFSFSLRHSCCSEGVRSDTSKTASFSSELLFFDDSL